jgi:predicted nucleic acid-binding protein
MRITCPHCSRRIRLKKSRQMLCQCGYEFEYSTYYRGETPVYLVDANILIYAIRNDAHHGKACQTLVMSSGPFLLGMTETVLSEIKQEPPWALKIYKVKVVEQELRELFTEKTVKQASLADLSLIPAARERPEVRGIVTYDVDFKNIATAGLVRTKEGRFFVGTADEALRKHGLKYAAEKTRGKK